MSENRRRHGGPGGPGRPGEKPKNFGAAVSRLIKELRPFHLLVILSIVLAIGGSVLSIIAPDYLSDVTDEITQGLVPDRDNLEILQTELKESMSAENIQQTYEEILQIQMDEETVVKIMMDESVSEQDKAQLQQAMASGGISDVITLPESVLRYILPTSEYRGVTFTTEDKIALLQSDMTTIPDQVFDVLLENIEIDGTTITVADQKEAITIMSDMDTDMSDASSMYALMDTLPESIQSVIKPHMNMDVIRSIVYFLIGLYLLSALFTYIQARTMAKVSNEFARGLRKRISAQINMLPLKYFDTHTVGDTLSRVTNDVDTVSQALNQSLASMVSAVVLFIGTIFMMFRTNAIMALTAIISSLLGFVLMFVILGKSQRYFRERQKILGTLNGHIEETYSSLNVVKAYNGTKSANDKFDSLNTQMYTTNWKSQFLSGLMQPMMNFVGNLGYVAVCVVGALLAQSGTITFGVIVAFITYVRMFTSPLSQIAQAMTNLQSAAAASERVFAFTDEEVMEDESNLTTTLEKKDVEGYVDFENVVFTYEGNETPTIHNFTAHVKPGQKIAIVGPTGAGKTTMVNLLMNFYEIDGGSIKIDHIPTTELKRANIHDLFTMVLQDTWLFQGTIRDNIVYNREGFTDEEVMMACKMAGLEHYIHSLPNGLDTVLESSDAVSSGQRQLITIARAMLSPTPFLILDEATSNVDTRTEEVIQDAMDRLSYGKTSFIIAHRLSTIRNADLILVMKDGNIVEQGTHDELLKQEGFYADLYQSQFAL